MLEAEGMLERLCTASTWGDLQAWHAVDRLVLADWLEDREDHRHQTLREMSVPRSGALRIPYMVNGSSISRLAATLRATGRTVPPNTELQVECPVRARLISWGLSLGRRLLWRTENQLRGIRCDRAGGLWLRATLHDSCTLAVAVDGYHPEGGGFVAHTTDLARSIWLTYTWSVQQLFRDIQQPLVFPEPWVVMRGTLPPYVGQDLLHPNDVSPGSHPNGTRRIWI